MTEKVLLQVVYQGHQVNYSYQGHGMGKWDDVVYNTGHWGPNASYPGAADVRAGHEKFFAPGERMQHTRIG